MSHQQVTLPVAGVGDACYQHKGASGYQYPPTPYVIHIHLLPISLAHPAVISPGF